MRVLAAILNIVWFLFICLVLVTDGFPKEALYAFFSLLFLLTPLVTLAALVGSGASGGWLAVRMKGKASEEMGEIGAPSSTSTIMKTAAIVCNVALLGFLCWTFLTQPPHPQEEGFAAFVVISTVTPILSVLAILRGGAGHARVLSGGPAV